MQCRIEALERAPYFLRMGARVVAAGEGRAEVGASFAPSHSNMLGGVHGGVSASVALWSASLAAWSSQYDSSSGLSGRVLSVHVSYLAAARAESLRARARVLARGRETVHAGAEVLGEDDRQVAAVTVVYRIGKTAQAASGAASAGAPAAFPAPSRARWRPEARAAAGCEQQRLSLLSPYSNAAGMELLSFGRDGAAMRLPLNGNAGPDGRMDPGALLGCIDTCAALSCNPFLEAVPTRSSTLSMSVVLGELPQSEVMLAGCLRSRDGESFTAGVETVPGCAGCFADASVLFRMA